MNKNWLATLRTTAACLAVGIATAANATTLDALGYFNYIDTWGINPLGVAPGRYGNVGGLFSPATGTTVIAESTVQQGPNQGQLISSPLSSRVSPATPYEFGLFAPYSLFANNGVTGAWTLTASNSATSNGSTSVTTLPFTVTPFSTPPGISNVQTNGLTTTPTLTWTQPAYTPPAGLTSQVQIIVWDMDLPANHNLIHVRNLSPQTTAYTVPAVLSGGGAMVPGRNYVISVETVLRNQADAGSLSMPNGSLAAKTRSFFNFTPSANAVQFPTPINLPVETQSGQYTFNMDVQNGVPYLIDPLVAIGYDFAIGAGDPLFASVSLPDLGNFLYELYLWSGSDWLFETSLAALTRFNFDGPGVDRFRILGIDPTIGVDPDSPTAFVTEVTFADSGRFTGTMTPITVEVPEPSTILLFGVGLLAFGYRSANRNRPGAVAPA